MQCERCGEKIDRLEPFWLGDDGNGLCRECGNDTLVPTNYHNYWHDKSGSDQVRDDGNAVWYRRFENRYEAALTTTRESLLDRFKNGSMDKTALMTIKVLEEIIDVCQYDIEELEGE